MRAFGKTISTRREANARWRWIAAQVRRVRPPLGVERVEDTSLLSQAPAQESIRSLEQRAKLQLPSCPRRARKPSDSSSAPSPSVVENMVFPTAQRPERPPASIITSAAMAAAVHFASRPPRRSEGGRTWARPPTPYRSRPRARRRLYAALLAKVPRLQVLAPHNRSAASNSQQSLSAEDPNASGKDMSGDSKSQNRYVVSRSPYALAAGRAPRDAAVGSEHTVTEDEMRWLH